MIQSVAELVRAALEAANAGLGAEAERLWCAVLGEAPDHPVALCGMGFEALRRGEAHKARELLHAAMTGQQPTPVMALTLATACRESGDHLGEDRAIEQALTLDPYFLPGLLAKAASMERRSDRTGAAVAYGNALKVAGDEGAGLRSCAGSWRTRATSPTRISAPS